MEGGVIKKSKKQGNILGVKPIKHKTDPNPFCMKLINHPENPLLEVCLPSTNMIIPVHSIMYIEAARKGSIITINDKDKTKIRDNNLLKTYEALLTDLNFFRLHRKYVVNLFFIESYCSQQVILVENLCIPLSCDKVKEFKERYIAFMVKNS